MDRRLSPGGAILSWLERAPPGAQRGGRPALPITSTRFFDAMEALAAGTRLGRPADDISAGLRRENQASHAILYRQRDDGIFVVRVLHQRMHFPDYLSEEW